MKRETLDKKIKISNDLMFYIYTHIETDINIDELAEHFKINKFYMHKIFKEIFGRNIYESIKSIRLQKASNLLLTNKYSTITEIANECGYSSQTSFIRAFKERFSMTPNKWRTGGYKKYSNEILLQSRRAQESKANFEDIQPKIVKMPQMDAYYIRHRGYGDKVELTWQKIQTWIYQNTLTDYTQISLFHDNPTITPLEECHYVACIVPKDETNVSNQRLPKFKISNGVYAKFDLEGERGDLLKFIHWVYHEWLPKSEYQTTTKPPYAVYYKNHYLDESKTFKISFYLSIMF
ncbi:MAG: AraC family transcriptional regulator [uncultured Sulfurovum sp.]|uniref:AraC family transcriptional regulator n=1 Tax=uncultured Sulfurovum sp. TaxID=269237 RepID=A0A6S6U373_9BACT|nr:MAG: AraC family transcriptional regulator [uncultured Sulfurovum sp.]